MLLFIWVEKLKSYKWDWITSECPLLIALLCGANDKIWWQQQQLMKMRLDSSAVAAPAVQSCSHITPGILKEALQLLFKLGRFYKGKLRFAALH